MHERRICSASVFLIVATITPRARADGGEGSRTSNATSPAATAYSPAYANDFSALAPRAHDYDDHPEAVFSYCARSAAVYECLSYAPDGSIRRTRERALQHGTAFAYRRQGNDTLLLTNDHVAVWPSVTDAVHRVDGIPLGCKLVSQTTSLVDNEHDDYARDDVPATLAIADPQLDVAILRAHQPLQVMPWKIGRSADLRPRNVVEVRGFPLGAFRATNIGKVISAHDHDDFGDWDHDDFVIDALLSSGNSGSPVLAVSRATGEYELVGIFHAGYSQGSALNVVVGIDQVRDLMTTLKRTTRDRPDGAAGVAALAAVPKIQAALGPLKELFFPFGGVVGNVRSRADGTFLFALYGKDFPLSSDPMLVLENVITPPSVDFGAPSRVWIGSPRGLKGYSWQALEPHAQAELARVFDEMAGEAINYAGLRQAREADDQTRQSADRIGRLQKAFVRGVAADADLVQTVAELTEKLAPQETAGLQHFAAVVAPPPPVASSPVRPSGGLVGPSVPVDPAPRAATVRIAAP
jgi:S1-C subfamily serine protease